VQIQWWCSARGIPWNWHWQAYPGVWLIILAFAWWARRQRRAIGTAATSDALDGNGGAGRRWRTIAMGGGVLLLWITLDWPVGPLGAGYLASVHAAQFIALAMIIPPLLLAGVDRGRALTALDRRPRARAAATVVTNPVVAGAAFTIVMAATHVPRAVDTLMHTQIGAFGLDMAWLGAGLLFWWPVVVRAPEREWFGTPLQMLYLFFGTQAHLIIAMWLLATQYPVYATYELAARVTSLSAEADQRVAGGIMILVAEPFILVTISVMFFRWFAASEREDQRRANTAPPLTEDAHA
jgi:cytochrome c oxidase assembly factor CtaG